MFRMIEARLSQEFPALGAGHILAAIHTAHQVSEWAADTPSLDAVERAARKCLQLRTDIAPA